MEERMSQPKNNVERLFRKMDQQRVEGVVEVEVYRQILFEENGLEPLEEDPSCSYHPDRRQGQAERPREDEESRAPEQSE